ncbi:MAG: DUF4382 domain-containing protein [Candidatus Bathyarchaeota archaeon]|nr:DUF4382 domain-containing protein [Candidatus Bathyarchaeota archaeon]MDH5733554.1 DUF4382 domain-containing protein [Candidatus Bathyarchaeota archaeon]
MTINGKRSGLYAVAGVLVAVLIIASVAISGYMIPSLRFPLFAPSAPPVLNTGTLAVMLTDAPVNLTHLNVTLDSISAHRQGYGNETWVDLVFINNVTEVYFDLLALQDVAMNLSITEIPPGNYTMIRMHIKTANATYANGNITDLDVPSEHISVIIHFEIVQGETTKLLIDIQSNWVAISQSKKLRPVLKATVLPS